MRTVWSGLVALAWLMPVAAAAQEQGDAHGGVYSQDGFDQLNRGDPKKRTQAGATLQRAKLDAAVAKMFAAVDTNRDGIVTVAEFQAIISARKEQAIADRFAAVDTNHDKSVSYAEFAQWQRSLGALALSDADAGGGTIVAEEIRYSPGRGREDEMIADLIEPLRTTVIVAANTNYDAGASLAELVAYEGKRFEALDTNHDGWLTEDEWLAGRRGRRGAAGPAPDPAPVAVTRPAG